jgi:hypothetical protein
MAHREFLNGVPADDGCSGAGWNGQLLERPAHVQATIRPPPPASGASVPPMTETERVERDRVAPAPAPMQAAPGERKRSMFSKFRKWFTCQ